MTVEKQGSLLKYCDMCAMKKPMAGGQKDMKNKHRLLIGFIFAFLLIAACLGFMQYTITRINNMEDEFRRVEKTLKSIMKNSQEPVGENQIIVPLNGLLDDDATKDYDDIYQDFLEYDNQNPELLGKQDYDSAINYTKDLKQDYYSDTEDSEDDDFDDIDNKILNKRSVVSSTKDGILINSESYAEVKAKNNSQEMKDTEYYRRVSISALPAKPSAFGNPWPYPQDTYEEINTATETEERVTEIPLGTTQKPSVAVRRSRIMHVEDPSKAYRRTVKKTLLKSGDMEYDSIPSGEEIQTTVPPVRQDRVRRLGRSRPLISIHFNGDTSRYVIGRHENFRGNGQLRHPQRTFVDWVPSDWVRTTGMDTHFSMTQGVLTVKETGLYLIYAQIYYLDEHDKAGFQVYKNNNMILQCTTTSHSSQRVEKGNTCYTAGVEFLSNGDKIYLADVTAGRISLFGRGQSFFGLVKLGDFKNLK